MSLSDKRKLNSKTYGEKEEILKFKKDNPNTKKMDVASKFDNFLPQKHFGRR